MPAKSNTAAKNLARVPTHKISQRGIALVPEGRRIFPALTIEENLELGGFHQTKAENQKSLEHIYQLFPRLLERRSQRAGTLSGGEQQMLAIGRGLMMKPKLLLLDEPSLGLAPIIIAQIFDIIRDIRAQGITLFLVEQNAHKALQIADRGYILELGRITHSDSGEKPAEKRRRPQGVSGRVAQCRHPAPTQTGGDISKEKAVSSETAFLRGG